MPYSKNTSPEEIAQKRHDWYQRNYESIQARRREYRLANRDLLAKKYAEWRKRNPRRGEPRREPRRERHRAEYQRAWRKANPGAVRRYEAARSDEQKLARAASLKRYKETHQDIVAAENRNTKAKRKLASGIHTPQDVMDIWKRQNYRCAVPNCTHSIAATGPNKYHVDHVKAIKNGGANDKHNLQILCRTHNIAKRDRDEYEWAQQHGRLFF
jgi:hypothetical protein